MRTIDYAAMSDPDRNPQFRRGWIELPERTRPAVATPSTRTDLAVTIANDWHRSHGNEKRNYSC
ncbi:MAG: hypothetical protein HQL37_15240 [Alphaproteobacteria bacterium]|nr:hypothetical protein [Alphaproteobacteria bacterium]